MRWDTPLAVLIGAILIAASIALTSRYQITAAGYGYGFKGGEGETDTSESDETVFRLDRWTGEIVACSTTTDPQQWLERMQRDGTSIAICQHPENLRLKPVQ